jgi:hypothetical protein
MAIAERIDRGDGADPGGLGLQLARLLRLHSELAWAEVRRPLVAAAVALGVALVALAVAAAAVVMLIAAALAPLFGARWPHLLVAGGGSALVALLALAWSWWRLRHLELPRETLRSLMENWEWLVMQVRSRLTLR